MLLMKNKDRRCKCKYCKARFLYDGKDILIYNGYYSDCVGNRLRCENVKVRCPICNRLITVRTIR